MNALRLVKQLDRHWVLFIGVLASVFCVGSIAAFYPGYMSSDSLKQLSQALGQTPYYDWHPPIMAFLWSLGIAITGKIGSMLVLQQFMLWTGLFLLARYVYKDSGLKVLSLMALAIGLTPLIINISGVIWKDVQMAFALLIATVLVMIANTGHTKRKKVMIYALIVACLYYALMLRYNAVFAAAPIAYLAVSHVLKSGRSKLIGLAGLLVGVFVASASLSAVLNVSKSNPTSTVMLDDIVNTASLDTIRSGGMNNELKSTLAEIKEQCHRHAVIMHSYHFCADSSGQRTIQYQHYDALRSFWVQTVVSNPVTYLKYRLHTFAVFMFTPESYVYVEHSRIDANSLGQEVRHPAIASGLNSYIKFFEREFGFIFRPYFWLVLCLVGVAYIRRLKSSHFTTRVSMMLFLSAILYIITYFPVVIAGDYRYIYWPVLAVLVATLLLVMDKSSLRR